MMIRLWLRLRRKNQLRLGQSLLLILARMRASGVGLDGEPIEHLNTVVGSVVGVPRCILVHCCLMSRFACKLELLVCNVLVMLRCRSAAQGRILGLAGTLLLSGCQRRQGRSSGCELTVAALKLHDARIRGKLRLNIMRAGIVCSCNQILVLGKLSAEKRAQLMIERQCMVDRSRTRLNQPSSMPKRCRCIMGTKLRRMGCLAERDNLATEPRVFGDEPTRGAVDQITLLPQRVCANLASFNVAQKRLCPKNRLDLLVGQLPGMRCQCPVLGKPERIACNLHVRGGSTECCRSLEIELVRPKCRGCCALAVLECVPVMQ
eukprot:comp22483_c0_seq10/m.55773 comp22483_c0_seq10/g.55773  ORF comp22483_c0_seq10/g.55773 comp22483_c0_seq10/m.55773 type:complete len:319 (+) comp22483_c0_seq10:79-1035(+)